ncbi:MAG: hypothetical protein WCW25_00615 [Patescibacteria group bacterium]|jgi:hypothetical protein
MKKSIIIAGALALLITASAAGAIYLKKSGNGLAVFGKKQIFLKASFAKVSDKAFNLSGIQSGQAGNDANAANSSGRALAAPSASGAVKNESAIRPTQATGMDSGSSSTGLGMYDKTDIACVEGSEGCYNPMPARYKYVYRGEKINLPDSRLPVFKRIKGFGKDVNASDILGNFGVDGINIGKFGAAKADNLSLTEQKEFGYSLNINFTEGNFSINQNWNTWPHPENQCKDESCYQSLQIKESDMLSDNEAIDIANRFLNEYGISAVGYGPAEVMNDWKRWYAAADDKANYYFPDTISVLYPLMLDDKPVYDEGGAKAGINVSINVREKKVSGVWNLNSQNYQSSLYDIETDWDKILETAKNGSGYYPYPMAVKSSAVSASGTGMDGIAEENADNNQPDNPPAGGITLEEYEKVREKVKEIELDTPVIGLVRMWIYESNNSDELLSPAVIFPVKKSDENVWQNYIIVPLVKEIIEKQNGGFGGGPVRIMESAPVK